MKQYLKLFCHFLSAVISGLNIVAVVLFWKWVKQTELQMPLDQKLDFSQYLTIQAYQNSILQLFLVVFGLGLAILGFYGYSSIRQASINAAIEAAEKKAEKVAREMVEKFMDDANKKLKLGQPSSYKTSDERIEEVKGKSKKVTKKATVEGELVL